MDCTFEKVGSIMKLTISGRLVAACSEEFKENMTAKLAENKNFVVDLSKMTHIDSSGLGVLVFALQKATEQGGNLKLACLQPRPRIVFDITKVYRIFEIFDSVDAALASFEAPGK